MIHDYEAFSSPEPRGLICNRRDMTKKRLVLRTRKDYEANAGQPLQFFAKIKTNIYKSLGKGKNHENNVSRFQLAKGFSISKKSESY